ncbi:hypothetical protein LSTR_LSTR004279 [Laodelphax striatellus]|uniref:Uncharacterized protein n=1 Tax=Laodelphax striatellus TaxID=195883 RepID=A0A482WHG5_LAOST|nr:hypothetical protein LSTR_LSTR004279 [Laodelphax striatellus]
MPAMPACTEESVGPLWSSQNGCIHRPKSVSPPSPASSVTSGPVSPPFRLDRSLSLGSIGRPSSPEQRPEPQLGLLARLIGWYPSFILHFARNLIATVIYLAWSQFFLLGPTLWLTTSLWMVTKCLSIPLAILKWILTVLHTPASERYRKKRTVMISCGSTVQALHLARNFYSAGFRVVVFELEGLFGLARYSTAVNKFYTVPRPSGDRSEAYLSAVVSIAEKEKVSYYVPVSITSTAYFDAQVKPRLELMGCTVFCPGLKEVCVLDDVYELMRRCQSEGMATPMHYPIFSKDDIARLYEKGTLKAGVHMMVNVGTLGCRDRVKLEVPNDRRKFRLTHSVNHQRPWIIVRDYPGDHYVTCTTVKESQVVANVTCRVEPHGGLTPVVRNEIDIWLQQFFNKLRFLRPVTGHLGFRFAESTISGSIVPLGCRVGVSLPYICHTSDHTRILCKPCRHFNSHNVQRPLVNESGRYWMHEVVINTLKSPGPESIGRLFGTLLDKREVLFVYWDPLPYCAYYHLQLPLSNVMRFLRGRRVEHNKMNHARFNRAFSIPVYSLPSH